MSKMKKFIGVLLSITMLLLSAPSINASAESNNTNTSMKISYSVIDKINHTAVGEKISVCLWCNGVNISEAKRLTELEFGALQLKDYTIEEINEYMSIYNRIINEMEVNSVQKTKDQLAIADEDIITEAGNALFVYMNADEIYKAANSDLIYSIDYYDSDTLVVQPYQPYSDLKYEDKFNLYFNRNYTGEILVYDELYYHQSEDGTIDWALVSATSNLIEPKLTYAVFGERVYTSNNIMSPFSIGYGIYDVDKDEFIDLCMVIKSGTQNEYNGLSEQVSSLKIGKLIGDMDGDDKISIKDATYIQKCLANINSFPDNDKIEGLNLTEEIVFFSDFNRDGIRNILDVNDLQKALTIML